MNRGVTLVGLGPGDPGLITRELWALLEQSDEIYLRTIQHPVVEHLPDHLHIVSFDDVYEEEGSFRGVYDRIVASILTLAERPGGVIYGVPGHPYVAEATCPEIISRARELGLPVRVMSGVSFLEPTFSALGVDPLPGLVVVDALEISSHLTPFFPPDIPALIAQVYSTTNAGEIKLTLMANYPDEHPVQLVHAAGTSMELVERVPLYAIDRSEHLGLLSSLFIPPIDPANSFERFQEVIARLRAPDGCPWDRVQTHTSLRPYLLEETYEALVALDEGDQDALHEELGDLMLQVVLHAQIASETGEFTMADILRTIHEKLIRRHPHVFGDVQVNGVAGVKFNWDQLKATERESKGQAEASVLDGVSPILPALAQADAFQQRAARVGFDWPDIQGVITKVREEIEELKESTTGKQREAELGDLLFAIVNLARWYSIDAESALRSANSRFHRRFGWMEKEIQARGAALENISIAEWDQLWELAKNQA